MIFEAPNISSYQKITGLEYNKYSFIQIFNIWITGCNQYLLLISTILIHVKKTGLIDCVWVINDKMTDLLPNNCRHCGQSKVDIRQPKFLAYKAETCYLIYFKQILSCFMLSFFFFAAKKPTNTKFLMVTNICGLKTCPLKSLCEK